MVRMMTDIYRIKSIFRYKTSAVCMLIGLLVSFLALYYGNRSQMRLSNALLEKNNNTYRHEIAGLYYGKGILVEALPSGQNGNCIIEGFSVLFDGPQYISGVKVVIYMLRCIFYILQINKILL